jgi:hypothetical protein
METDFDMRGILSFLLFAKLNESDFDNPPLLKGRRFLPDSESPWVGSCGWPHSTRAHFTGDPGLAGPWVLQKLGVPMQTGLSENNW